MIDIKKEKKLTALKEKYKTDDPEIMFRRCAVFGNPQELQVILDLFPGKIDINAAGKSGGTALYFAAERNKPANVRFLLLLPKIEENKLCTVEQQKKTALQIAREKGHVDVIEMFAWSEKLQQLSGLQRTFGLELTREAIFLERRKMIEDSLLLLLGGLFEPKEFAHTFPDYLKYRTYKNFPYSNQARLTQGDPNLGKTVLHVVAQACGFNRGGMEDYAAKLQFFLLLGADPNAKAYGGSGDFENTILHTLLANEAFVAARVFVESCQKEPSEVTQKKIRQQIDYFNQFREQHASTKGFDCLKQAEKIPLDFSVQDINGATPVLLAAKMRAPDMVAFLLKCDDRAQNTLAISDQSKRTLAHYAAILGDGETIQLLKKHDAWCMRKDAYGNTPADYMAMPWKEAKRWVNHTLKSVSIQPGRAANARDRSPYSSERASSLKSNVTPDTVVGKPSLLERIEKDREALYCKLSKHPMAMWKKGGGGNVGENSSQKGPNFQRK